MTDQGGQDKDEVMGMEKFITKPGQAPVAHFVSGLNESEEKMVVWEIRNLSELLEMSTEEMKKNGITFDAGHSIGLPTTWYFYFARFGSVGRIGCYLKLSDDSKLNLVEARCSVFLSCEEHPISFHSNSTKEFRNPVMKDGENVCLGMWPSGDLLERTRNGKEALEVTLNLKVFSNKGAVKTPKAKARILTEAAVISDFEKLLESGDGADVEISVPVPKESGGKVDSSSHTKKVHKSVLMARSSVFSKMFANGSQMVEAKTGKVVIKDFSPQGLGVFLHYIYTGKVLDEWLKVPEEILNASEKYDCGRLKNYCGHNLMSAVTTKNAWEMFQLAKLHKLSFAMKAITEFISRNTKAVLNAGDGDEDEEDTSDEESGTE